jgi:hypothetical protein
MRGTCLLPKSSYRLRSDRRRWRAFEPISSALLLKGPDRLHQHPQLSGRGDIPEPFFLASRIPRDQAPASSAFPRAFFSAPARPAPERDSLVSGQFVLSGDLRWNRLLRNSTVFSVPRESCFLGLSAFVAAEAEIASTHAGERINFSRARVSATYMM